MRKSQWLKQWSEYRDSQPFWIPGLPALCPAFAVYLFCEQKWAIPVLFLYSPVHPGGAHGNLNLNSHMHYSNMANFLILL